MARLTPLSALRPPPSRAAAVASVPYDVISTPEARALAAGNDASFLHVIRPEIDLPEGQDLYADVVYETGRANLERFISSIPFTAPGPQLLVYRLVQDGRAQIGVVGGCSVDEYDAGGIAIHERTRPAKEDDRTRHVTTMRCQAEPIFLAYRADARIDAMVEAITAGTPEVDFVADDGVQHSIWTVSDAATLSAAFDHVPRLYVADGHHRAKSASRAREQLAAANPNHTGTEAYNHVMSVVFPDTQLAILPYNRVVTDLRDRSPGDVLAALNERFGLTATDDPTPGRPQCFCVWAEGSGWHRFSLSPAREGILDALDCALLQEQVLAPLLGIENPRTDPKIDFVGGSRGTDELERRAAAAGGVAFSMHATSMAQLFAVADAGEIMPPKSTWFEPKLRSGLFLHRI
ncbi:MAG: DUF1015 domain-containing protein [Proteobacteria bacterium]|nr:DUF1015 domain-containing protein [Pseudomonadota bacterium]